MGFEPTTSRGLEDPGALSRLSYRPIFSGLRRRFAAYAPATPGIPAGTHEPGPLLASFRGSPIGVSRETPIRVAAHAAEFVLRFANAENTTPPGAWPPEGVRGTREVGMQPTSIDSDQVGVMWLRGSIVLPCAHGSAARRNASKALGRLCEYVRFMAKSIKSRPRRASGGRTIRRSREACNWFLSGAVAARRRRRLGPTQ